MTAARALGASMRAILYRHKAKAERDRRAIQRAMDRKRAIAAVREAMNRELELDPLAARDGFTADTARCVIDAYFWGIGETRNPFVHGGCEDGRRPGYPEGRSVLPRCGSFGFGGGRS